jgi:ubiquitin-like 1-activating enzyme E1 A
MVEIFTVTTSLADTPDSFFKTFHHVICIMEAKTKDLIRVDNICRANGVKFFAANLWGMFGYSFADLQEHKVGAE